MGEFYCRDKIYSGIFPKIYTFPENVNFPTNIYEYFAIIITPAIKPHFYIPQK